MIYVHVPILKFNTSRYTYIFRVISIRKHIIMLVVHARRQVPNVPESSTVILRHKRRPVRWSAPSVERSYSGRGHSNTPFLSPIPSGDMPGTYMYMHIHCIPHQGVPQSLSTASPVLFYKIGSYKYINTHIPHQGVPQSLSLDLLYMCSFSTISRSHTVKVSGYKGVET